MFKGFPEIKIDLAKVKGKKIALVKANFNSDITDKMLDLAIETLQEYKVEYEVFEVAGSFEIPYKIKSISVYNNFDGYIVIGCLIKGETDHYEYVSQAVSYGLMELSIKLTKPIGYAILNCPDIKYAFNRVDNVKSVVKSIIFII